jgi:disulfide bond formation protein DsbB
MYQRIGLLGVVGMVLALAGLALITVVQPLIGVGLALVLLGLGVTIQSALSRLLRQFGMA